MGFFDDPSSLDAGGTCGRLALKKGRLGKPGNQNVMALQRANTGHDLLTEQRSLVTVLASSFASSRGVAWHPARMRRKSGANPQRPPCVRRSPIIHIETQSAP